jgi:hypothetical protein
MADTNGARDPDVRQHGLDPEFLSKILPLCREANAALPAEAPIPPSDGAGAHLRRWRRLTDL